MPWTSPRRKGPLDLLLEAADQQHPLICLLEPHRPSIRASAAAAMPSGVEAVVPVEGGRGADQRVLVGGQPEPREPTPATPPSTRASAQALADAADHVVLLGDQQSPAARGEPHRPSPSNGASCARPRPPPRARPRRPGGCGGQSRGDRHAVGHDREVSTVAQLNEASQLELGGGRLVVDVRLAPPAQAEVHGPVQVDRRAQRPRCRGGVAGTNDGHVDHRAQQPEVLGRMMRRSIEAERDPRVVRQQAHRKARIGQVGSELLGGEQAQEAREGRGVGDEAERREAGGHADHVLLGDAHVEEAPGMAALEVRGPVRVHEIGRQDDDAVVLVGHVGQHFAGNRRACQLRGGGEIPAGRGGQWRVVAVTHAERPPASRRAHRREPGTRGARCASAPCT